MFQKVSGSKKFYAAECGCHDFLSCFLVSQCRKTSYRNPSVIHYFRVSENFVHKRNITQFCIKNFCLTVPKTISGERISVPKKFVQQKILCMRGGILRFSVKIFFSHSSEKVVGEFICVSLLPGIEEFCAQGGCNTIFCRLKKTLMWTLLCSR